MDQPLFLASSSIHFSVEEKSRLYAMLCQALQLAPERTEDIARCARAAVRGLTALIGKIPHAADWAEAFQEFAESDLALLARPQVAHKRADPHALAHLLVRQPRASLPIAEQAECEAVGALSLVQLLCDAGRSEPQYFYRGLAKAYSDSGTGWAEVRKVAVVGWNYSSCDLGESQVEAQRNFVKKLHDLRQRGLPAIRLLVPRPTTNLPTAPPAKLLAKQVESSTTAGADQQSRISPNFDLYRLTHSDDQYASPLAGFRVGFDWEALQPQQLRSILARLAIAIADTNRENQSRRIAACGLVIALFARTSLSRSLQLPIVRHGTLHLDLDFGVIRRKTDVLVNRTDSEQGPRKNGNWFRTPIPENVRATLFEAKSRFPAAESLGQLLSEFGVDEKFCFELLNLECDFVHRPESARFARSLSNAMLSIGIHPAVVFLASGDTTVLPSADAHYLCRAQSEVHFAVSAICEWAGLDQPPLLTRDRKIGSPKLADISELRAAFEALQKRVQNKRTRITTRADLEERIAFFNLYVKAVALQVLWGVGARFARFETLTFNRLYGIEEAILVSDKDSDNYSKIRCVPISDALRKTLLHYLVHLRAYSSWLEKNELQKCAELLCKIANGERQTLGVFGLLHIEQDGGLVWTALTVKDVRELADEIWPGELNRPRHFFANELVSRNVAQVAIDAFSGRHCRGAAPFGLGSGLSVSQYVVYLGNILNQIHTELNIQPLIGLGNTAL
jgi:hypothetical protein